MAFDICLLDGVNWVGLLDGVGLAFWMALGLPSGWPWVRLLDGLGLAFWMALGWPSGWPWVRLLDGVGFAFWMALGWPSGWRWVGLLDGLGLAFWMALGSPSGWPWVGSGCTLIPDAASGRPCWAGPSDLLFQLLSLRRTVSALLPLPFMLRSGLTPGLRTGLKE